MHLQRFPSIRPIYIPGERQGVRKAPGKRSSEGSGARVLVTGVGAACGGPPVLTPKWTKTPMIGPRCWRTSLCWRPATPHMARTCPNSPFQWLSGQTNGGPSALRAPCTLDYLRAKFRLRTPRCAYSGVFLPQTRDFDQSTCRLGQVSLLRAEIWPPGVACPQGARRAVVPPTHNPPR